MSEKSETLFYNGYARAKKCLIVAAEAGLQSRYFKRFALKDE